MSLKASLTPDDLLKGELASKGWHPAEIVDYTETEADTDGSTNINFFFKIIDGGSKGITARRLFNEKALGFMKNLLAALDYPKNAKGGYDIDGDKLKQAIGRKLEIYIVTGTSNKGNDFNDVKDFRKMGAANS